MIIYQFPTPSWPLPSDTNWPLNQEIALLEANLCCVLINPDTEPQKAEKPVQPPKPEKTIPKPAAEETKTNPPVEGN